MYNQCNYIIMATNDNNIEKSYEFVIYEGDKKFKRMYQAASPEEQKTLVTIFLMTQMPMIWKLWVRWKNGYVMDNP